MNRELRDRWVAALRSGKYTQGRRKLRNTQNNTFCCLGVLCDLEDVHFDGDSYLFDDGYASSENLRGPLREDIGGLDIENELTQRNDHGDSFAIIAQFIEDNL